MQPYQQALIRSGYKYVLKYNKDRTTPNTTSKKPRARNIVWYNPPYNKPVPPILAENSLILYTTTSQGHILIKIFNRNTLEVRYACVPDIATTISSHDHKILNGTIEPQKLCNCRDKSKCSLSSNCQQQSTVYQGTVITDSNNSRPEAYIALTEQTLMTSYNNHTSSFNSQANTSGN